MKKLTATKYIEQGSFGFWCQSVIPLVYDESLSYYEMLCKLTMYIKNVIENVDNIKVDITNLINAYNELQDYVDNYFKNLDIQTEINNKLDEMASDGTLNEIINNEIFGELNSKIDGLDLKIDDLKVSFEDVKNEVNKLNDEIQIHFIGGTNKATPLGNCMMIQGFNKNILIDFGQQNNCESLISFLNLKQIKTIDYVIISHYHADHIGGETANGLLYLLNQTNFIDNATFYLPHNLLNWGNMVGDFAVVEQAENIIKEALTGKNIIYPSEGDLLQIQDMNIYFYNLSGNYFNTYYKSFLDYRGVNVGTTNYNNFSMNIKCVFGNNSFLSTGDSSYQAQLLNAEHYINATILQIPHHGLEREAPNIILSNIHPKLGVICGSTFYETLQMSTPIVVKTSLMGGDLYYTTEQLYLTANIKKDCIWLSPNTVELYNMPSKPMTVSGGIPVPITPTGEAEDFNELLQPCELLFQNATVLKRWTNAPALNSGGKLVVVKTTQSNSVRQFFITSTLKKNIIATRYWDQTEWGEWTYIVSVDTPV